MTAKLEEFADQPCQNLWVMGPGGEGWGVIKGISEKGICQPAISSLFVAASGQAETRTFFAQLSQEMSDMPFGKKDADAVFV